MSKRWAAAGAPVVFVHGMFLHATSWGAWVELFRAAGYAPVAPGWPGAATTVAEAREQPGRERHSRPGPITTQQGRHSNR